MSDAEAPVVATRRWERLSVQFGPDARAKFLAGLTAGMSVAAAARSVGVTRFTAYDYRERGADPKFTAQWKDAVDTATDILDDEAVRRAREGTGRPVFYKGEVVGAIQDYSDHLLMFLLKARRPEVYREVASVQVSGPNGGPVEVADVGMVEVARRMAYLLSAGAAVVSIQAPESVQPQEGE